MIVVSGWQSVAASLGTGTPHKIGKPIGQPFNWLLLKGVAWWFSLKFISTTPNGSGRLVAGEIFPTRTAKGQTDTEQGKDARFRSGFNGVDGHLAHPFIVVNTSRGRENNGWLEGEVGQVRRKINRFGVAADGSGGVHKTIVPRLRNQGCAGKRQKRNPLIYSRRSPPCSNWKG